MLVLVSIACAREGFLPHATDYTSSKSTGPRDPRIVIVGQIYPANTRLLAPIVPLYTTEIPSKMQEDTGRAGRNS